jgi:hypothetical protein
VEMNVQTPSPQANHADENPVAKKTPRRLGDRDVNPDSVSTASQQSVKLPSMTEAE